MVQNTRKIWSANNLSLGHFITVSQTTDSGKFIECIHLVEAIW